MISNGHRHVLHLSVEGLKLGTSLLFVLNLHGAHLSDLIVHHVEDVLCLSCFVENGIHELVCVLDAAIHFDLLALKSALSVACHFGNWLQHIVADLLDASLHIKPVKLVHFESDESFVSF